MLGSRSSSSSSSSLLLLLLEREVEGDGVAAAESSSSDMSWMDPVSLGVEEENESLRSLLELAVPAAGWKSEVGRLLSLPFGDEADVLCRS